jgi:elongator complex protein 1
MEESPNNDHLRRIEIGSQIVIAIPGDTRVVFQMPRGNLETIHPRGLLLERIKSLLNNKEYLEAFLMCRKNRLDLNLLIDYDYESFAQNISTALTQIEKPDYINLLIASLKDINVTQTIYKNSCSKEVSHKQKKVNLLCDLIVSTLEEFDKEKYLNSILTGLSKKSPPDLENATKRILSIKEARGTDHADDAIKYLIFLADPDKLFDYALGAYDLELVVMVAQNSQKVYFTLKN